MYTVLTSRGGHSVRPKNSVSVFGFLLVRSLETQDRISSKKSQDRQIRSRFFRSRSWSDRFFFHNHWRVETEATATVLEAGAASPSASPARGGGDGDGKGSVDGRMLVVVGWIRLWVDKVGFAKEVLGLMGQCYILVFSVNSVN